MMLEDDVALPGIIKGELLDAYLYWGWYRYGHMIFTTHFIAPLEDKKTYRVYWLRYKVDAVHQSKKIATILAANRHLTISCKPFELTDEVDALHKLYVASLKFKTSESLLTLLSDINNIIYDTHIIEVRDNGKLIAGGIFDLGKGSIAGIINFYDPAYKKYSLGKYLIIQKYKYCIDNNIAYYYPGYYSPEHPLFDYKLFLDKAATEVYLPELGIWIDFNKFNYPNAAIE